MRFVLSPANGIAYHQRQLVLSTNEFGLCSVLYNTAAMLKATGILRITANVGALETSLFCWIDENDIIHPAYLETFVDFEGGHTVEHWLVFTGNGKTSRPIDMFNSLKLDCEVGIDLRRTVTPDTPLLAQAGTEYQPVTDISMALEADINPEPSNPITVTGNDVLAPANLSNTLIWKELGNLAASIFSGNYTLGALRAVGVEEAGECEIVDVAGVIGDAVGSWQFYQDEELYARNVAAVKEYSKTI